MQTRCIHIEATQLLGEYEALWQKEDVTLPLTVTGGSMRPFLASGRDIVYLRRPRGALHCGDIALYRAAQGHGILHRVVAAEAAGYTMRGDAQRVAEHGVAHDRVLAVAVGVRRKGVYIARGSLRWRLFALLSRRALT